MLITCTQITSCSDVVCIAALHVFTFRSAVSVESKILLCRYLRGCMTVSISRHLKVFVFNIGVL